MSAAPPVLSSTLLAEAWVELLAREHGPLILHQSAGCCDGSAPMCYLASEFKPGERDILIGHVGETPYWIGQREAFFWEGWALEFDVAAGRGNGFSLEGTKGIRFLSRTNRPEVAGNCMP